MWPFSSKKAVDNSPAGIALAEIGPNPQLGDWTKKVASMGSSKGADIKVLKDGLMAIDIQLAERQVGTMPIEKMSVHTSKTIIARKYFDRAYPRLDLNVLSWRKKQPGAKEKALPVFGVFDPFCSNNMCQLNTHQRFGTIGKSNNILKIGDHRHPFLWQFYDDISTGLIYEASLSGFIPAHVRQHLQELQDLQRPKHSYSSDPKLYELLLIAECDWQIRATPPDPLAIALMGIDAWLLASFDTTAIENVVASEFTS